MQVNGFSLVEDQASARDSIGAHIELDFLFQRGGLDGSSASDAPRAAIVSFPPIRG
jgi:hypothetical protein